MGHVSRYRDPVKERWSNTRILFKIYIEGTSLTIALSSCLACLRPARVVLGFVKEASNSKTKSFEYHPKLKCPNTYCNLRQRDLCPYDGKVRRDDCEFHGCKCGGR